MRTPKKLPILLLATVLLLGIGASASPALAQTNTPAAPIGIGHILRNLLRGPPQAPPSPAPQSPAPADPAQNTALAPAPPPEPATSADPGDISSPAVEQRLSDLHYRVDGTASAVMAFQKVNGMDRTGELTPAVARAVMSTTSPPAPLVPGGAPHRVEIDLTRQVLFLYEGGSLAWILPVSSGTSSTPTPTGSYRIYSQRSGWETSRYGRLYNSQYFVGGYAIHGSLSVPNYAASHGCVRIPMSAADILPGRLSIGTPVHVLG